MAGMRAPAVPAKRAGTAHQEEMTLSFASRTELPLSWRVLASSAILLTFAGPGDADTGELNFPHRDLDELIEQSTPHQKGTVELKMLDRVSILAEVGSLPRPRKTMYLMEILATWGVNPLPEVHEELVVVSPTGQEARVYLETSVTRRIRDSGVAVGDTIRLSGYHIYNSKHGPGLLIAGYEPVAQGWIARMQRWLGGSPAESTP